MKNSKNLFSHETVNNYIHILTLFIYTVITVNHTLRITIGVLMDAFLNFCFFTPEIVSPVDSNPNAFVR